MLGNPIRYNDPTGHLCEDENSWGYCGGRLPSPQNVKEEDRNRYMRDVGRKYKIRLAVGDYWEYLDYADVGQGAALGWTPEKDNDPYLDRNGAPQYSKDPPVYITAKGFESCDSDLCLAGLMAHEATHSTIELKIEQTSPTDNPRISNHIFAEEMLADIVAMQVGDPQQLLNDHYYTSTENCKNIFGDDGCSNPLQMLEDYYLIDLSNISSSVYRK